MKKTGLSVMKKITIDFEQHSLDYFTYHAYNSNEFKTLLTITFPGYPSTFTIGFLEKSNVFSQNESDINLNLSISIFDLSLLQNRNKKNTNTHPKQKNAAAPTPNIVVKY